MEKKAQMRQKTVKFSGLTKRVFLLNRFSPPVKEWVFGCLTQNSKLLNNFVSINTKTMQYDSENVTVLTDGFTESHLRCELS